VVCLRGTEDDEHLFDAERFAAMKRGAMLVNVARGTLVDENALLEALRSGQIAGAGLDVEEHEPVRADNPLEGLPQVFMTPHIAGFTTHVLDGTVDYVGKVLAQYKAGQKMESVLNEPKQPRVVLRAKR
jgi:phosphoglycerate dehydrogenase-like enzyme